MFTSEERLTAFMLVVSTFLPIAFWCFGTFCDVTLVSELSFGIDVLEVKYVFACAAKLCTVEVVVT